MHWSIVFFNWPKSSVICSGRLCVNCDRQNRHVLGVLNGVADIWTEYQFLLQRITCQLERYSIKHIHRVVSIFIVMRVFLAIGYAIMIQWMKASTENYLSAFLPASTCSWSSMLIETHTSENGIDVLTKYVWTFFSSLTLILFNSSFVNFIKFICYAD